MTKKERENSNIIDFSRRKRIAKGSGTSVEQVGQLVKQFNQMKKMMKKSGMLGRMFGGKGMGGGDDMDLNSMMGMGDMGGMGMGGGMPNFSRGSNFTPKKKKKNKNKKNKKKRR